MDKIIVIIFMSFFVILFGCMLIDKIFKLKFFCKLIGWHSVSKKEIVRFNGCSKVSICEKCGDEVLQDSQGNWF